MDKLEEMMVCLTVCQQQLITAENVKPLEMMDWAQIELEEHDVLEGLMEDLGIKCDSIGGSEEINFEEEMEYLERMLVNDDIVKGDDGASMVNDEGMMTNVKVQDDDLEYVWMEMKEASSPVVFEINTRAYFS